MSAMLIVFVIFLVLVAIAGGCLFALIRVDAVMRDIYMNDRKRWRELGEPTGFFWRPEENVQFMKSVGARNAVMIDALLNPAELRGRK